MFIVYRSTLTSNTHTSGVLKMFKLFRCIKGKLKVSKYKLGRQWVWVLEKCLPTNKEGYGIFSGKIQGTCITNGVPILDETG